MRFIYENNEQIVIEIKKLMLENKVSQREIAEKLGIRPQGLTKLLNKKNFGFEDAEKILSAMGYTLVINFEKSTEDYIMLLDGSATTGEKIMNHWGSFRFSYIGKDENVLRFNWSLYSQHGNITISLNRDGSIQSGTILCKDFPRPLGLYNDDTLLPVLKRMLDISNKL